MTNLKTKKIQLQKSFKIKYIFVMLLCWPVLYCMLCHCWELHSLIPERTKELLTEVEMEEGEVGSNWKGRRSGRCLVFTTKEQTKGGEKTIKIIWSYFQVLCSSSNAKVLLFFQKSIFLLIWLVTQKDIGSCLTDSIKKTLFLHTFFLVSDTFSVE